MNPDAMIYFVQVCYGGKLGLAWVERDPGRMDRSSTVEDITRGEWGSGAEVVKVLECNPVENICNDITDDILAECLAGMGLTFDRPNAADEQAARFDHARDHRKHSTAAE